MDVTQNNKKAVALIVAAVSVIFAAWAWGVYGLAQKKIVQIALSSSVPGTATLYYDLGEGFSEKNASKADVHGGSGHAEYQLTIPDKKIHNLRFDPLMTGGTIRIQRIRITDGLGNTFLNIPLEQLAPVHQIRSFVRGDDSVMVEMDDRADDPQLKIGLPGPLSLKWLHNNFYLRLARDLFVIILIVLALYLLAVWNDRNHAKRRIAHAAILCGLAIILYSLFQIVRGIQNGTIQPTILGDTEAYLYMAAQKWTSPDFYQGLRQFGVPLLYSLVDGANNIQNIPLLQTVLSYVSWVFLALIATRLVKDPLTKALVFLLIACIPLNDSIHSWHKVILSESLSFSFLAFFLGAYLWYYRVRSIASIAILTIIAILFVLMRDADAFLLLFMTLPIAWVFVQQIRGKTKTALRHGALLSLFVFIFIGSSLSANDMHFKNSFPPFTTSRQYFSLLNVMGQIILPSEDRVRFFEAHGLKVTPALMSRKGQWASSDDWRWYRDPELAAQREWLYRHGKSTYAKYLVTHPGYVFSDPFHAREYILFPMKEQNAWFHKTLSPVPLKWLSAFFLNNEAQVRFAVVITAFALILLFVGQLGRQKGEMKEFLTNLGLISYIILVAVPYGLICYHGDPMEVDRHALGNIIRLNVGVVLLYMLLIDFWIAKVRQAKQPVARPQEANPLS